MKKLSLITILAIFIVPMALYHVFKAPVTDSSTIANAQAYKARVLQFTSTMCYDCKRIEKEIAPLRTAPEYRDKIVFQKINVSSGTPESDRLIRQYNVDVVPTLVFFDKNGAVQGRIQGYTTQQQLREQLNRIK